MAQAIPSTRNKNSKKLTLEFILLFGLVSALGDITYETGRGISGPYLAFLGASAATIGWASGLWEFLGYALRLVSGYLASRTRTYWIATYIGYGLLLSIPLLAFTNRWEIAVVLLILELSGKPFVRRRRILCSPMPLIRLDVAGGSPYMRPWTKSEL